EATGNERLALKGQGGAGAESDTFPARWLERKLTLPTLAFSADAALGVGQSTAISPVPRFDTPLGTQLPGAGLNLEAAMGLPRGFELGVRFGVRFGQNGALSDADAYGRLFDPMSLRVDTGTYSFANPEFRITESLFDGRVAAVGFDVRLTPGFSNASSNIVSL